MFHFSRCPPFQLSLDGNAPSAHWVSPFGDLRIAGCLSPPRSFSQIAASFIGSQRRGIHHLPLHLQLLKHQCFGSICNFVVACTHRQKFSSPKISSYSLLLILMSIFNCQRAFGPETFPNLSLLFPNRDGNWTSLNLR